MAHGHTQGGRGPSMKDGTRRSRDEADSITNDYDGVPQ